MLLKLRIYLTDIKKIQFFAMYLFLWKKENITGLLAIPVVVNLHF